MGARAELVYVLAIGAVFVIWRDTLEAVRSPWFASEEGPSPASTVPLDPAENWPWYWDWNPLEPYEVHTAADGPVWARNLTTIYPKPAKLVNLACGGATVDNDVVQNWNPPLDFKSQISAFQRWLTPPPERARWHSYNSIFVIEFGTNDVISSFHGTERTRRLNQTQEELHKDIMWRYFDFVERLYNLGARAFAFHLLVPFDRARAGIDFGPELQAELRVGIQRYNAALRRAAHSYCTYKFEQTNGDIFCSVIDLCEYHLVFVCPPVESAELFIDTLGDDIMDNPEVFGFKEPVDYCPAYAPRSNAEPDMDVDPSCIGPVGDYVWKDALHPSWTFHQYWAQHFYLQTLGDLSRLHPD
ncbi:hypothetical protein AURDEDRAFT_181065 [Auricularia subglabra TFB-10046 SS5]|nr:hypothetical protein AURDEDRAFT_181065 [Auricularia subglabra TFB-10046 SS5]